MELNEYIQTEMGNASNLITDMYLRGATVDEMTSAVKYSMAVIDGIKRGIDYILQSARDNRIAALKGKYQRNSGAMPREAYRRIYNTKRLGDIAKANSLKADSLVESSLARVLLRE